MQRIARPYILKRTPRSSLRRIGVPNAHDTLAVYLRWVRQARYDRAHAEMAPQVPSSAHSVVGSDEQQQHVPSLAAIAAAAVQVDSASLTHDLLCVGARFDEGEADAARRMVGYAPELDIPG